MSGTNPLQALLVALEGAYEAARRNGSTTIDADGSEVFLAHLPGMEPITAVKTPDGDVWLDPAVLHRALGSPGAFERFEAEAQQAGGGSLADRRAQGFGREVKS